MSMGVYLAIFAVAVNRFWLWSVREDVKLATDAGALAAAAALADDDLLRGDPANYPALLERASNRARALGAANPVRGEPFPIWDNPDNDSRGDIVFGKLTRPRSNDFVPVPGRSSGDASQGQTNTVVISGRLTRTRGNAPGLILGIFAGHTAADVQAVSAATLDRGVRGFRPRFGAIPLAPIALRSGAAANSWESLVENHTGPDAATYVRSSHGFTSGPDGIAEFPAVYATVDDQVPLANVAFLFLPSPDLADLNLQLQAGVTADQLALYGGSMILPVAGTLDIAGQQVGPAGDDPAIEALVETLTLLKDKGEPRIWPLYQSFDVGTGSVRVSGFVAARVVNVAPPASGIPLQFTLQATVVTAPMALTDTDIRGVNATMNDNRYICKIRRIE